MKILIVDDEKETRESLRNIIKVKVNSSYEIAEAENGLEALGVVESFQPDIVLTDVLMPKMDGIRFTALLKSQPETKHIFVAAITGLSGEEQIEKIYASGVDFYIAKPFQLDDIVARLKVITSLIFNKSDIPTSKPSVIHNNFNDTQIKRYFVTFSIAKENDIFLIFDYFSKQDIQYNSIMLKDLMVILVKAYRKAKIEDKVFDLVVEESETYFYLTIKEKSFITIMEKLVKNNFTRFNYSSSSDIFSFRIDIASFIDSVKDNSVEEVVEEIEVTSATELMIIASDDILDYVNELNYDLQEYKSLARNNNRYDKESYLLLVQLLNQYIRLFKKVPNFDRVSIALESVVLVIEKAGLKSFSDSEYMDINNHMKELNDNINNWIQCVIINQDRHDVHDIDYIIMDSCRLIEKDFS